MGGLELTRNKMMLIRGWCRQTPTVTWENRAPKDWQVIIVPWWCRVFLLFSRVVWGDYGKPCHFLITVLFHRENGATDGAVCLLLPHPSKDLIYKGIYILPINTSTWFPRCLCMWLLIKGATSFLKEFFPSFSLVLFLGVEPTRLGRGGFIATTPRELVTSSGIGPASWQCRLGVNAACNQKSGG